MKNKNHLFCVFFIFAFLNIFSFAFAQNSNIDKWKCKSLIVAPNDQDYWLYQGCTEKNSTTTQEYNIYLCMSDEYGLCENLIPTMKSNQVIYDGCGDGIYTTKGQSKKYLSNTWTWGKIGCELRGEFVNGKPVAQQFSPDLVVSLMKKLK